MGLQAVFSRIVPSLGSSVMRFPLAAGIAAIFALFHVFELDDAFGLSNRESIRVSLGLISAFFWTLGVALLGERAKTVGLRVGLSVIGIAAIAALHFYPELLAFQPYLFLAALGVFVGVAAYLPPAGVTSRAAFWQFNHRLWLGAGLALVGAVLFAGGLSLIIETLELLFEFDFPSRTHEKIWIIGLGFVAPLNWMSMVPRDFHEAVPEGEQTEFTSKAVATIVKYILVPLLLVYTAILYVYAAKIAADGVLPKGRLGPMVLAYGAVGTLTILMAFPTRNWGGPLVAFFWRHWFWLTVGPVILLFLAAYTRVDQYGVTEERYLVLLAGFWLGAWALVFAFWQKDRDIRLLPISLMGLLLVASVGPWGAKGLSLTSQVGELETLLEKTGRLSVGRVASAQDMPAISAEDARRVRSIIYYINRRDALAEVRHWFNDDKNDPFDGKTKRYRMSDRLFSRLGVTTGSGKVPGRVRIVYQTNKAATMPITGLSHLAGPYRFHLSGSKQADLRYTIEAEDGSGFEIALSRDAMVIERPRPGEPERLTIDLGQLVLKTLGKERTIYRGKPMIHARELSGRRFAILFQNFSGQMLREKVDNLTGSFWIFWGEP